MKCKHNYYAASGSCIQCKGVGLPQWVVKALAFVPQQHAMGSLEKMLISYPPSSDSVLTTAHRFVPQPIHGPNMQVSISALVIGACVAIAYFIYSWSPFRRLEGWMKMALRLIFAPGALGDWQQQLVKRQARRHDTLDTVLMREEYSLTEYR